MRGPPDPTEEIGECMACRMYAREVEGLHTALEEMRNWKAVMLDERIRLLQRLQEKPLTWQPLEPLLQAAAIEERSRIVAFLRDVRGYGCSEAADRIANGDVKP